MTRKVAQKYCETSAIKFGAIVPSKSSCLPVYATCKSSIPNLGTHQGFFFLFWSKRSSGQEILQFFFLKKKSNHSNTVFLPNLPHYFGIDTITVWGEACSSRGKRGEDWRIIQPEKHGWLFCPSGVSKEKRSGWGSN